MSNTPEIQAALNCIQDYIKGFDYLPKGSKIFFMMWTLINNLYNAKGYKGNEARRAVELGNEYDYVFALLNKNAIIKLIIPECARNRKSDLKPSKDVKSATFALRATLNLFTSCNNCRGISSRM